MAAEPEVYESPDPVVVAVSAAAEAASSDAIATQSLDVAAARKAFRSAEGTKSAADGATGQTVYEMLATLREEPAQETTLQRLQRLQMEVAQLAQDVTGKADNAVVDEQMTAKQIREQVAALQQQLHVLAVPSAGRGTAAATATVTGRLLSQLQLFEQQSLQGNKAGEPVKDINQVVYELFYSGDLARNAAADAFSQLDARVSSLEAAVGDVTGAQLAAGDLAHTVASLGSRVALLDGKQLDDLAARIKPLLVELEKLAASKKAPATEVETKVATLFERLDRWDSLTHTLPALVDRLRSLQALHSSAAALVDVVQGIARDQATISDQLQSHGALLSKVEQSLNANTATVQKNVDVLDKRVSALLAKLQTLSGSKA